MKLSSKLFCCSVVVVLECRISIIKPGDNLTCQDDKLLPFELSCLKHSLIFPSFPIKLLTYTSTMLLSWNCMFNTPLDCTRSRKHYPGCRFKKYCEPIYLLPFTWYISEVTDKNITLQIVCFRLVFM